MPKMIKEAADTVLTLKGILEEIHSGSLDVMHEQMRIRNNTGVNGITTTALIAAGEEAFMLAANVLICAGDVAAYHLKPSGQKDADFQAAISALRAYRDTLVHARVRPDAEMIGSADSTMVEVPDF